MFQSMFGRFRPPPKNIGSDTACNSSDSVEHEEDGFLLIGQTQSDRSTVTHQQFIESQGLNHPHEYSKSNSEHPPDYQAALNSGMAGLNVTGLPPFGMDPVSSNNNHMLPISDIPFQLSPWLTVLQRVGVVTDNLNNQRMSFDWSKYDYDFNFELSYLKEHGIEDSRKVGKKTMQEERNLIQF